MSYHLCEKPRKFFGPRKFYDRYCMPETGPSWLLRRPSTGGGYASARWSLSLYPDVPDLLLEKYVRLLFGTKPSMTLTRKGYMSRGWMLLLQWKPAPLEQQHWKSWKAIRSPCHPPYTVRMLTAQSHFVPTIHVRLPAQDYPRTDVVNCSVLCSTVCIQISEHVPAPRITSQGKMKEKIIPRKSKDKRLCSLAPAIWDTLCAILLAPTRSLFQ